MRLRRTLVVVMVAAVAGVGSIGLGVEPAQAAPVATVTCASVAATAPTDVPPLAGFSAISPRRLVDTRSGIGGVAAPVDDGCVIRVDLDAANVSAEASAVSLSVTALAEQRGYLSVFPCRSGRPATSNLNTRGQRFPTPNLVVAVPDASRDVCIFTQFRTDVVIDLTGWWTVDGDQRFSSISPVRVDDSRTDPGRAVVGANSTRTIDLSGFVPPGTSAVVANLTVTEPAEDGYITAFPCDTRIPGTSNLNFRAGESRAVSIISGIDPAQRLCLRSVVDTHVVVDVSGYYAPAPQFGPAAELRPLAGRRLADSRSGGGGWSGKFGSGTIRRLRPVAAVPFASQATAVVLNVVATEAEQPGYVTIYPCDDEVPFTSVVNYAPGGESTNMAIVDLSAAGEICFFVERPVHLVVDLFGVLTAPTGELVERIDLGEHTWPPFDADGTDYAVECNDRPVDLQLDLLVGTTARVNGVPVGSGTTDLPVGDDDLIWVQLRRGNDVRNHWFRCVPDDFPRLEIDRPGDPAPGWYLTTFGPAPDQPSYLTILDHHGAPVWYKRLPFGTLDLKRRSDGRLLMTPYLGTRYGVQPDSGYLLMSVTGTMIDEHTTIDDPSDPGVEYPTDHHDYVALGGGGRAMLTYPLLTGQDLSVLGAGYAPDDTIADGVVQEIDAAGELVWSWRTSDHVGYDEVTYPVRWPSTPDYAGGEVDVFHLNSLERVRDGSGDYIVSARHLDAVLRIDRSSGDLDWILGSLPADAPNKAGAQRLTIVNDPLGGPRRPHDARMAGDVLTLFDNRTDTGQQARAVAYRIDATAGTATLLWQIDEPAGRSSGGLGSARVAADGSVLIGWGAANQPMFEEYDADHEAVMRISQVGGGVSYRIVKEPPSSFTVERLRASAGGAAESL